MKNENLFCVIIPASFFVFLLFADRLSPNFLLEVTSGELGLVESLQAILLLCAAGSAGTALFQRHTSSHWIRVWITAGMAGILYVFLEEISYGQHYFNWNTPESWQEINDQKETNLHNTSSWLDQKPRLLLEFGVMTGGIIVPLLRKFKPRALPERFKTILPDDALFTTAALAILPRMYERSIALADLHQWHIFTRTSEVQEFYFYYFTFLYFIFLRNTLRAGLKATTKK